MHENNVAHRYVLSLPISLSLYGLLLGTVHPRISCLTQQICILNLFTPPRSNAVWTSVTRLNGIHEHDVRRSTSLSTLACPVGMILPMYHHSTNRIVVATS